MPDCVFCTYVDRCIATYAVCMHVCTGCMYVHPWSHVCCMCEVQAFVTACVFTNKLCVSSLTFNHCWLQLYRHGDRSPVHTFPNGNVPDSYWHEGLGQLSKTGRHQAYLLGRFFHKRYVDELKCSFLFNNYTRTQIYVRSTGFDRTLMTAQCQLAGLFKPNSEQTCVQELKWQPIPIHTVPVSEDTLLRASNCPRMDQLDKEVKSSAEYKKANDDNKVVCLSS